MSADDTEKLGHVAYSHSRVAEHEPGTIDHPDRSGIDSASLIKYALDLLE